jgi:hypothetical protein
MPANCRRLPAQKSGLRPGFLSAICRKPRWHNALRFSALDRLAPLVIEKPLDASGYGLPVVIIGVGGGEVRKTVHHAQHRADFHFPLQLHPLDGLSQLLDGADGQERLGRQNFGRRVSAGCGAPAERRDQPVALAPEQFEGGQDGFRSAAAGGAPPIVRRAPSAGPSPSPRR